MRRAAGIWRGRAWWPVMTLALAIQAGVGGISGALGVFLLSRKPRTREAVYPLRIAGVMLLALCLFLTGFALVFWQLSGS